MPAYVNPGACDTCKTLIEPLCQYICPNDLMLLETKSGIVLNREPDMCSECFACVKICPQEAVAIRGYADFVPLGAEAKPTVAPSEISWKLRFRDGRVKSFLYPTRIPKTTLPGTTNFSPSDLSLHGPLLFGETEPLAVPHVKVQ